MPASSVVALGLADAVIAFSRGWARIMLRNPLRGSHYVLYFSRIFMPIDPTAPVAQKEWLERIRKEISLAPVGQEGRLATHIQAVEEEEKKVKSQELGVQIEELRVQVEELRVQIDELRVQIEELRVNEELRVKSEELRVQSEELRVQSEALRD